MFRIHCTIIANRMNETVYNFLPTLVMKVYEIYLYTVKLIRPEKNCCVYDYMTNPIFCTNSPVSNCSLKTKYKNIVYIFWTNYAFELQNVCSEFFCFATYHPYFSRLIMHTTIFLALCTS